MKKRHFLRTVKNIGFLVLEIHTCKHADGGQTKLPNRESTILDLNIRFNFQTKIIYFFQFFFITKQAQ